MVHSPREYQQWEAISNLRPAEEAKVLEAPQESFRAVLSSVLTSKLSQNPGLRQKPGVNKIPGLPLTLPSLKQNLPGQWSTEQCRERRWMKEEGRGKGGEGS